MKIHFRTHRNGVGWLRLLVAICAVALPAMASLGGDLNSIQDDATHMKTSVKVQKTDAYEIHEMKVQNKTTTVREYVGPDGHVFAVVWAGPYMPDLSQLLGSYLQQYSTAVQEEHAKASPGRHPLVINQPGLVVESSGGIRSYHGRAYIPDLLPKGVQPEEVR